MASEKYLCYIFPILQKLIQDPVCLRLTPCESVCLPSSHSLLYQHKTSLNLGHCQFTCNHGLSCLSAHISAVFLYCNGPNALATALVLSKHSCFQLRCLSSSKYTESVSQKFSAQRRTSRSRHPIPSLGAQKRRKKRKDKKVDASKALFRKWRHLWLRVNRQLRHA